jgi:hypothetical protein
MNRCILSSIAAAVVATVILAAPASAAPFTPAANLTLDKSTGADLVRYRGYRGGYYRHDGRHYRYARRNRGLGIGLGIAGAVIGGAIIADQIRRSESRGSDGYERCARTFRSFDPDTGTYTTYDGDVVPCPYL